MSWLRRLRITSRQAFATLGCMTLALPGASVVAAPGETYRGICDASGAIAIDADHFMVAEDEDDVLYVYRNDQSNTNHVGNGFDLGPHLDGGARRECDLEGGTRKGDRAYWIASHGRNKRGKLRPTRHRLVVTDLSGSATGMQVTVSGSWNGLVSNMLEEASWPQPVSEGVLNLMAEIEKATQLRKQMFDVLAPKKKGLNIEAVAARPTQPGLLIGFRNPLIDNKALVVTLENADALLAKEETQAKFGEPVYLDLGGRGIRSMEFFEPRNAFLVLAGPSGTNGTFKLFAWSGAPAEAPATIKDVPHSVGSNPEAIIVYPGSSRIQILYDEGENRIGDRPCKTCPAADKRFSAAWHEIE